MVWKFCCSCVHSWAGCVMPQWVNSMAVRWSTSASTMKLMARLGLGGKVCVCHCSVFFDKSHFTCSFDTSVLWILVTFNSVWGYVSYCLFVLCSRLFTKLCCVDWIWRVDRFWANLKTIRCWVPPLMGKSSGRANFGSHVKVCIVRESLRLNAAQVYERALQYGSIRHGI